MARKTYDDDDGRTIADMSGVSSPRLFGDLSSFRQRGREPEEPKQKNPYQDDSLTPKERRLYILGALKAALLIGFVYIAGLAAVVGLLLLIWSIL